jgi:hypothetical protein
VARVKRFDPWSEDAEPAKPPTNWGCAVAAILGSIAAVVGLIFVCVAASSLIDGIVHGSP